MEILVWSLPLLLVLNISPSIFSVLLRLIAYEGLVLDNTIVLNRIITGTSGVNILCLVSVWGSVLALTSATFVVKTNMFSSVTVQDKCGEKERSSQQKQLAENSAEPRISSKERSLGKIECQIARAEAPSIHILWDSKGHSNRRGFQDSPKSKLSMDTLFLESSGSESCFDPSMTNFLLNHAIRGADYQTTESGDASKKKNNVNSEAGKNAVNRTSIDDTQKRGSDIRENNSQIDGKSAELKSSTSYPSVQEKGLIQQQLYIVPLTIKQEETPEFTRNSTARNLNYSRQESNGTSPTVVSKQKPIEFKILPSSCLEHVCCESCSISSKDSEATTQSSFGYSGMKSKKDASSTTASTNRTSVRSPSSERRYGLSLQSNQGSWKSTSPTTTVIESRMRPKTSAVNKQDKIIQNTYVVAKEKPASNKREVTSESVKSNLKYSPSVPKKVNNARNESHLLNSKGNRKELGVMTVTGKKPDSNDRPTFKKSFEVRTAEVKHTNKLQEDSFGQGAEKLFCPIHGHQIPDIIENELKKNSQIANRNDATKEIIRICIASNNDCNDSVSPYAGDSNRHTQRNRQVAKKDTRSHLSTGDRVIFPSSSLTMPSERSSTDVGVQVSSNSKTGFLDETDMYNNSNIPISFDVGVQVSLDMDNAENIPSPQPSNSPVSETGTQVSLEDKDSSPRYCSRPCLAPTDITQLGVLEPLENSVQRKDSIKSPSASVEIMSHYYEGPFTRSFETSSKKPNRYPSYYSAAPTGNCNTVFPTNAPDVNKNNSLRPISTGSRNIGSPTNVPEVNKNNSVRPTPIGSRSVLSPTNVPDVNKNNSLRPTSGGSRNTVSPTNDPDVKKNNCFSPTSKSSTSSDIGVQVSMEAKPDARLVNRVNMLESRLRLEELRNRSWISRVTQAEEKLSRLSRQFQVLDNAVSCIAPVSSLNSGIFKNGTLTPSRQLFRELSKIKIWSSPPSKFPLISSEGPISPLGLKDLIQQLREEIDGTRDPPPSCCLATDCSNKTKETSFAPAVTSTSSPPLSPLTN